MPTTIPRPDSWTYQRARVASLTRDRAADDPELLEAKRLCRLLLLEQRILEQLALDPPFTAADRRRLARLFR